MLNAERMMRCAWELSGATVTLDDVVAQVPSILDEVRMMDPNTFSEELDKAIDKVRAAEKLLSEARGHLIATKKEWVRQMSEE